MNENFIDVTVQQLYNQANIDTIAIKCCKKASVSLTWDDGDTCKEFAEFMKASYPLSYIFSCSTDGVYRSIRTILSNVLADISFPVHFQETTDFYFFHVTGPSFSTMLPLVATRAVFCFLKGCGVKCVIYKKDKNVCPPEVICATELAFLGKTECLLPGFEPIAKACSQIKGKMSPWYPASEPIPDPSDDHPDEASLRFSGAPWFHSAQNNVTLIGAGGLGSNIAVSLCRVLGDSKLYIYDSDKVEHRNLAGQNFGVSDIGKYKTICVQEQCLDFNPRLNVVTYEHNFGTRDYETFSSIVITGLDNMASRNLVFYKWQKVAEEHPDWPNLLIDARLSAEKWQVFCIKGNDQKALDEYSNKWLFPDSEATSDVCSYKQTAFAAQMCASFVTNLYVNYCANLNMNADDPLLRYLPFMTEYDASLMHLKFTEV